MKFYNNQPRVEKVIAIFQNILIFWRVLVFQHTHIGCVEKAPKKRDTVHVLTLIFHPISKIGNTFYRSNWDCDLCYSSDVSQCEVAAPFLPPKEQLKRNWRCLGDISLVADGTTCQKLYWGRLVIEHCHVVANYGSSLRVDVGCTTRDTYSICSVVRSRTVTIQWRDTILDREWMDVSKKIYISVSVKDWSGSVTQLDHIWKGIHRWPAAQKI